MAVKLSDFLRALVTGYLVVIFSLVFLVIPVAGLVILLVVAPFLGGREGARQLNAQWADFFGLVAGLIWAFCLPLFLVVLLDTLSAKGIRIDMLEGWLLVVVAALQLVLFWWGAHSMYGQRESRASQRLRLRSRDFSEDLDDEELRELRRRHHRIVEWGAGIGRSKRSESSTPRHDPGQLYDQPPLDNVAPEGTLAPPDPKAPEEVPGPYPGVPDQTLPSSRIDRPDPGRPTSSDGSIPTDRAREPPETPPRTVPEDTKPRLTREEIFGPGYRSSPTSPGQGQIHLMPPDMPPLPGMAGPKSTPPPVAKGPSITHGHGRMFRPKGASGKAKPAKPVKGSKRGSRRTRAAHLERSEEDEPGHDSAPPPMPRTGQGEAHADELPMFGPPLPVGQPVGRLPTPKATPAHEPPPQGPPPPLPTPPGNAPSSPRAPIPPPLPPRNAPGLPRAYGRPLRSETPYPSGPRSASPVRRSSSSLAFAPVQRRRIDHDGLEVVVPRRETAASKSSPGTVRPSPTSGPVGPPTPTIPADGKSTGGSTASPGLGQVMGAIAKGTVTGLTKATTDILTGTLEAARAQAAAEAEAEAKGIAPSKEPPGEPAKPSSPPTPARAPATSDTGDDPIAAAVASVTAETEQKKKKA